MKTFFARLFKQNLLLEFKWFFPLFNWRRQSAKQLIPIPVINRKFPVKTNIILFAIFCVAIHNGEVFAGGTSPLAGENLISNLYSNVGGVYSLADGNMVLYSDAYSNAVDNYDARKLTNPGENFGITRNNTLLAVEKRRIIRDADSVFFDMTNLKNIQYKLEIKGTNLDHPTLHGFLEDAYTGTRLDLSLNDTTSYVFNITPVAASYARNRFRIIFTTVSGSPLPVNFSTVSAKEVSGKVLVNWQVNNEFNVKKYQIESSTDGRNFSVAGEINVVRSEDKLVYYQWTDNSTLQNIKYYRIKSVDADGQSMYSATVVVTKITKLSSFIVLSNPVQHNEIGILFQGKPKDSYQVRLTALNGTKIFTSKTVHPGGTAAYYYQLPSGISTGTYYAEIIDSKSNSQPIPVAVIRN